MESAREKTMGSTLGLGIGLRLASHLRGPLRHGLPLTKPMGLNTLLLTRPEPYEGVEINHQVILKENSAQSYSPVCFS